MPALALAVMAITLIVGSSVSRPSRALLLVLYNVVYVLPLIAIVIVCAVLGDCAQRVVAPISRSRDCTHADVLALIDQLLAIADVPAGSVPPSSDLTEVAHDQRHDRDQVDLAH